MAILDWVVQNETWRGTATTLQYNETLMLPLVIPDFTLGGVLQENYRLPEVYSGMTVETVLGEVHYHLYPVSDQLEEIFQSNYMTELAMAVVRAPIDPALPQDLVPNPTYDLRQPYTANDTWLWKRSVVISNIRGSLLNGAPARPSNWRGTVFIRTSARRRLEPLDGLWLYIQWGRLATGIGTNFIDLDETINIIMTPRVRTLVRPDMGMR